MHFSSYSWAYVYYVMFTNNFCFSPNNFYKCTIIPFYGANPNWFEVSFNIVELVWQRPVFSSFQTGPRKTMFYCNIPGRQAYASTLYVKAPLYSRAVYAWCKREIRRKIIPIILHWKLVTVEQIFKWNLAGRFLVTPNPLYFFQSSVSLRPELNYYNVPAQLRNN